MENIPAIGKSLSGHHILCHPGEINLLPISQQFQFYHLSFLAIGHTHTSSTRTWRASSSYRPCYGPSSPASLSYQTAAAPRRWLHQTPPSDSFASVPSTRCTSPLRLFPRAPWHLPLAPVSPAAGQARSALWRPVSSHTACLRGGWGWGGNGGGFRGPTSPRCFERRRGWPRWSRAVRRQPGCSRSGAVCRTRPEGDRKITDKYQTN